MRTFSGHSVDVEALMASALDWIVDNLAEFHPFKDGRDWEVKHAQRVSELAILAACLQGTAADDDARLAAMLDMLSSIQNHPRFRDRVLRMPAEFVLYCDLYALLARMGREDAWQREVLRRALKMDLLHQSERLPHRVMDVSLSLELAGLEADWPTVDEAFHDSILSRDLDPHHLRESALYALTHVIMFKGRFGLGGSGGFQEPVLRRRLAELIPVLLIDTCLQQHWDLVSEMLICWDCAGLPRSYAYYLGWAALASKQRASGAFPGPESDIRLRMWPPESSEQEAGLRSSFEHCYHTTLTALVAGSLRLDSGAPGADVEAPADAPANPTQADLNQRRECLELAMGFFAEDLEEMAGAGAWQPDRAAQDLVGLWIYGAVTGQARQFEQGLETLARARREVVEGGRARGLRPSPDLNALVLAGLIATAGGSPVPEFSATTSAVMKGLREKRLGGADLVTSHRVLSHLGLVEGLPALSDEQVAAYLSGFEITGSLEELDEFVSMAEVYSTQGEQAPEIGAALRVVLQGMEAKLLRDYRLTQGMRALRALNCLGPPHSRISLLAYRFLCAQQQADGSFGFLGPELELMGNDPELAGPEGDAGARGALLVSQVTAHAVWTLAESMEEGWQLDTAFHAWCVE